MIREIEIRLTRARPPKNGGNGYEYDKLGIVLDVETNLNDLPKNVQDISSKMMESFSVIGGENTPQEPEPKQEQPKEEQVKPEKTLKQVKKTKRRTKKVSKVSTVFISDTEKRSLEDLISNTVYEDFVKRGDTSVNDMTDAEWAQTCRDFINENLDMNLFPGKNYTESENKIIREFLATINTK